jgi:hypothetical protein
MKAAVILVKPLAGAAAVRAPKLATQTVCTLADLAGDFATHPQGITTGLFASPFAATGVIHFDANGGFAGIAAPDF